MLRLGGLFEGRGLFDNKKRQWDQCLIKNYNTKWKSSSTRS